MTECFSSAALMTIGLVRKDDLNRFYSVTSGWIMRESEGYMQSSDDQLILATYQ